MKGYHIRARFRNISGTLGTMQPVAFNCWRVTIFAGGNDINLDGVNIQAIGTNGPIVFGGAPLIDGQVVNVVQVINVRMVTSPQPRATLIVEEYLDPIQ